MAHHVSASSVALRVVLYFARAPSEELTAADVAEKFNVPPDEVSGRLSRAVRGKLLAKDSSGPGRGRHAVYSAGSTLLELIGQNKAISADSPELVVL